MNSFEFASNEEAKMFVAHQIDVPENEYERTLPSNLHIHVKSHDLSNGAFTNSYDLSFSDNQVSPVIDIMQQSQSIIDTVQDEDIAAISGGFFLLTDDSTTARELSLNFAASRSRIRNLPVCDREAVLIQDRRISVKLLHALGTLLLNGNTFRWSGSLSEHDSQMTVFANGNLAIDHVPSQKTTTRRVLRDSSRFTPSIIGTDYTDVGLIETGPNEFLVVDSSHRGQMDILDYNFIIRMKRSQARRAESVVIDTIDNIHTQEIEGGFTTGPFINAGKLDEHPVNRDESLGSHPPFSHRRMARLALYMTSDNRTHFRLFDGRPDSLFFEGVTPREVQDILAKEATIDSGVFLDPGQTAKMYLRANDSSITFGNRHYLKWPEKDGDNFIWTPDHGRPLTSIIRLQ